MVGIATAALFTGAMTDVPRAFPPVDDSWSRDSGSPLFSATEEWEDGLLNEPMVIVDDRWRMWYRGGWDAPNAIGYATCPLGSDPTVTSNWTRNGIVYGNGYSDQSEPVAGPEVRKVGDAYHLSAKINPWVTSGHDMAFATSTDGIEWTTAESSITLPSGYALWGNNVTWHDGTQYQGLFEAAGVGGSPPWRIFRYTSADGLTWSIANSGNPLSSLEVAAGGMYGGPAVMTLHGQSMPEAGGSVHLWYHASTMSGNLPTNIYHAYASPSNLDAWTKTGAVLTHAGSGFEDDQVADPSLVVYRGTAYLFYSGVDNVAEVGGIGVATAAVAPI